MALWSYTAIFFALLDRLLKTLSINDINFAIVGDFLKFSLAKNYFIAFSIPVTGIILNYIILAIVLILIFNYLKTNNNNRLFFLFIILGAASNLFDRFKYGYVIDYLSLKWFTVFNIADVMIVCSILCLLFFELRKKP